MRGYAQVRQGDSEGKVLALLGRPYQITGRPDNVAWDSDETVRTNSGECVKEFWYAPPVSLIGEAWTIGFDDRSNVVSKYHYLSP